MKRMSICNLGLAMLALLLISCGGEGKPTVSEERASEGRVREVDLDRQTLVIRHRLPAESTNETIRLYRTYQLAPDCRISTFDKPDAGLEDLELDDKVDVRYVQVGQDFLLYRIKPD